jgi:acyl phosphate:glycerol-3-phosphate acyltransferase
MSVVLAYLVGSIPFAWLLARRSGGGDLRRIGSGNLGAANVARLAGIRPGVVVALLDMSKGIVSVLIAERVSGGVTAPALAGLAAIVGHIYPVWLGFRGGKGVATACGVFLLLAPMATVSALVIFTASVWTTKYISLGSVLATAALPPIAYWSGRSMPVVLVGLAAASLIVFRHRSNITRLRAGTEHRFGRRG